MARKRLSLLAALLVAAPLLSAQAQQTLGDWQMQDAAKVPVAPETVSTSRFKPMDWYKATVPGTVLTTLVANKVYPEPLYGENMRSIPESLNRASYWYRTSFNVPAAYRGRHIWLNFAGINYSAEVWINGHKTGTLRGAFLRGGFDITPFVKAGQTAVLAVLVTPQPHPGIPHEHTVALGVGQNGGDTAIDGPTFLSTIGWDWLPAIRDRDTGIWLPVTLSATGPVILQDPRITTTLTDAYKTADITINTTLENQDAKPVSGTLTGVIQRPGRRHLLPQRPHHRRQRLPNRHPRQQGLSRTSPHQPQTVVAQRLRRAKPQHPHPQLPGRKAHLPIPVHQLRHPQDRVPGTGLRKSHHLR